MPAVTVFENKLPVYFHVLSFVSLGKLFRYLDEIDANNIMAIKRSLSGEQQENLRKIFELIHKSDMKCPLFLKNSNASSSINSRIKKLMALI